MRKKIRDHFQIVDPSLYAVIDDDIKIFSLDTKDKTPSELFTSLTRSIVGQQLSGKAAAAIYKRFENAFPRKKVTAIRILEMTEHDLRALGMSYAKARALRDYSDKYIKREVSFKKVSDKSNDEVKDMLLQIKGVGPWTCEMFLMFSLGREDIFSSKDLGLQKGIQKIYGLEKKPDEKEALAHSLRWAPYRTYASVILWHTVDTK